MSVTVLADGSSSEDSRVERVEINRSDAASRWRVRCPNGHSTIEPSAGGIWCRSCARSDRVEDPHHREVLDKRTGETIACELVDWEGGR